jgi:putative ABC transport system permease protein
VIAGDPRTALKEPGTIAVSESFARKYFGDANPTGQIVYNDAEAPQKIALVFADQPRNTH